MLNRSVGRTRTCGSNFILAVLLLTGHNSKAPAQSAGTFTVTGPMTTSRFGHTATLLPNGSVLITGGGAGAGSIASAELYDPSTRTFRATGSMKAARSGHTATLLADGKVLIAGGAGTGSGNNFLASAELYDPSTETFTATGHMLTAQFWHNATLLPNGKVLIARGGANAELYDALSGTFFTTGGYAANTYCDFCATSAPLLPDGDVMVVGGGETQLYDYVTGAFSITEAAAVCCHVTATLLTDGKVLLAGGEGDGVGRYAQAELYDPASRRFTLTGSMACGRGWHSSTLLPDGTALVAGGESGSCGAGSLQNMFGSTDGAEIYTPSTGTFHTAGNLLTPREGHTATLLSDGRVLIAGGLTWLHSATPVPFVYPVSAELYTPVVLVPAPVLLSVSTDGRTDGAILHAGTGRVVSSSNPSFAGEAVEIYGIGLVDGGVVPPQVSIGGRLAEVLFFGKVPGFAGLNQVNVKIPSGIEAGTPTRVRLTYLDRHSNEVTIALR